MNISFYEAERFVLFFGTLRFADYTYQNELVGIGGDLERVTFVVYVTDVVDRGAGRNDRKYAPLFGKQNFLFGNFL